MSNTNSRSVPIMCIFCKKNWLSLFDILRSIVYKILGTPVEGWQFPALHHLRIPRILRCRPQKAENFIAHIFVFLGQGRQWSDRKELIPVSHQKFRLSQQFPLKSSKRLPENFRSILAILLRQPDFTDTKIPPPTQLDPAVHSKAFLKEQSVFSPIYLFLCICLPVRQIWILKTKKIFFPR